MEQPIKSYKVEIYDRDTKEVVETIECRSFDEAERVERGVNINLNRRQYRTRVNYINQRKEENHQ